MNNHHSFGYDEVGKQVEQVEQSSKFRKLLNCNATVKTNLIPTYHNMQNLRS